MERNCSRYIVSACIVTQQNKFCANLKMNATLLYLNHNDTSCQCLLSNIHGNHDTDSNQIRGAVEWVWKAVTSPAKISGTQPSQDLSQVMVLRLR
jgi:hypothetical protein